MGNPYAGMSPEALAVYGLIDGEEYLKLTAHYGQPKNKPPRVRKRSPEYVEGARQRALKMWAKRRAAKAAANDT